MSLIGARLIIPVVTKSDFGNKGDKIKKTPRHKGKRIVLGKIPTSNPHRERMRYVVPYFNHKELDRHCRLGNIRS